MADRYFKADDVLFYLYESAEGLHDSPQFVDLLKCCVEGINCLPTADVVEVVRCRECVNWDDTLVFEDSHYCYMHDHYTESGFFCANGEGKECMTNL